MNSLTSEVQTATLGYSSEYTKSSATTNIQWDKYKTIIVNKRNGGTLSSALIFFNRNINGIALIEAGLNVDSIGFC